jgi:hypothetical protein
VPTKEPLSLIEALETVLNLAEANILPAFITEESTVAMRIKQINACERVGLHLRLLKREKKT